MKRSGQVGLVVMGGAAFAATFAAGMAYFAWQKPSHAAQPVQTVTAAQNCTTRADGTQNCQPARRGFCLLSDAALCLRRARASASSAAAIRSRDPQSAALTSKSRAYTPTVELRPAPTRGGFGATAQNGSYRTSSAPARR